MSMICDINRIALSTAQELLQKPEKVLELLHAGYTPSPAKHTGLLRKLFGSNIETPTLSHHAPIADKDICSLDKSWHLLHYLFTGSAWGGDMPEAFLLNGGIEVGTIDVGYGPARCFLPPDVSAIGQFLTSITIDFMQRYNNITAMREAELYGIDNKRQDSRLSDNEMDHMMEYVQKVRLFTCRSHAKSASPAHLFIVNDTCKDAHNATEL